MNDPGLEDAIATRGKQLESRFDNAADEGAEQQSDQPFLLPARWWYASTGFPLLAGTLGPMANTFSICALVQYWRIEIPPGKTEVDGIDIKDPRWFDCPFQINMSNRKRLIRILLGSRLSMPSPLPPPS
jgi:potassium channel subfamily K, other eukaryote